MTALTSKGQRAERWLEKAIRWRDEYPEHLTRLTGADERDKLDEQISRVEGDFADSKDPAGYFVRAHPRRGTRGVRAHTRKPPRRRGEFEFGIGVPYDEEDR